MNRQPHICIVSCQHLPDDVRVTHKIGMAFRQAGFRVTWVGPKRPRSGDDYGIEFLYYPLGKGRLGRLLHYRKARRLAGQVDGVDVFYAIEPDSASVAVKLARSRGAKAIFDIHEIFHDEMLGRWARGFVRKLLGFYVRRSMIRVCSRCDLVLAVSDVVMAPYAHVASPQLIVRNCAPVSFAEGDPAEVCAPGREDFVLMHGKSALARGTLAVVKAMGLAAKRTDRLKVVMFDVFGPDPQSSDRNAFNQVVQQAEADGIVGLRPRVPMAEMRGILRSCDVGIVAYDRTWGVCSLPNRLFEYMAVGLPVIAPTYSQEIRRIVETERCGLLVDCEKPEEIADAVVYLREHPDEAANMGRRGREAFLARHNWSREIRPLLDRIRQWCR